MVRTTRIPKRMPTVVSNSLERMGVNVPGHKILVEDYRWIDDYADGEWRTSRGMRCRLSSDGDHYQFQYEVDSSIRPEKPETP